MYESGEVKRMGWFYGFSQFCGFYGVSRFYWFCGFSRFCGYFYALSFLVCGFLGY